MRRRHVELAVGLGLMLGPLVYALSLEPTAASECAAEIEIAEPAEPASTDACEQLEPITIEVAPEPTELEPVVVEPAPEPTPEPSFELARFLFVTDAGVVLSTEAKREWGKGKLFVPKGKVSYRAAKRANPITIPAALWSMRGRTFDMYGADGKLCSARLGELRVVGQYDGWSLGGVLGQDWYDEDPESASKAEILAGLWQRDDLWLVADFESADSCKGALWARDAELPPPMILRRSTDPTPASEARLAAFLRSEELAETERSYRAEYAELDAETREYYPNWDEMVAEHGANVWSWIDVDRRAHVVGLEFGREPDGCGEPLWSRHTALDLVRGDELVPTSYGHSPTAIFDADLDGELEFLYVNYGGRWLESPTLETRAVVEEDWMCPC
jgi:hypothetical protein